MIVTLPAGAAVDGITLPHEIKLTLPPKVFGIMGPPGSGKTEFMSTLPSPKLVIATDPMSKMQPYFDKGAVSEPAKGKLGQPLRTVTSLKTGNILAQVEGFYDFDPMMPTAMQHIMLRAEEVQRECREGKWASVILDSYSGLEDMALFRRRVGAFSVNNNDGRAAYNAAKDDCLQVLMMRLVHLDNLGVTVGVTFHISEKLVEAAGTVLYNIKAIGDSPGTLGRNISERYRSEATMDGVTRQLVTRPDGRFNLTTMINAPSPCPNKYQAVFSNWIAAAAKMVLDAEQSTNAEPAELPTAKENGI